MDTFCRRSRGGAEEEVEVEEEKLGWMGARVRARAPSWCGGPRSLCLSLWPPNPRHTDPRACSIGSCPSAGKRVNAREPPMGPSRATKRPSSLSWVAELSSLLWGSGWVSGGTSEICKKICLEYPDLSRNLLLYQVFLTWLHFQKQDINRSECTHPKQWCHKRCIANHYIWWTTLAVTSQKGAWPEKLHAREFECPESWAAVVFFSVSRMLYSNHRPMLCKKYNYITAIIQYV